MTDVLVDLVHPVRGGVLVSSRGTLTCALYRRQRNGTSLVLVEAFEQVLTGPTVITLAPTGAANAWVIRENVPGGTTRYVQVPDSSAQLAYADLVDVLPSTLLPGVDSIAAWQKIADDVASLKSNDPAAVATALGNRLQLWQPNNPVPAQALRVAPDGSIVQARAAFTTGATYNAANWTVVVSTAASVAATYLSLASLLEFVPHVQFGDSYGSGANSGSDPGSEYAFRVASRLRTAALSNKAVFGTRMSQIATAIQSGWTVNSRGLVSIADGCINDSRVYNNASQTPTTVEAFRSALAYLTARAFLAYGNTAWVLGPQWAAGVGPTGATADIEVQGTAAYIAVQFTSGTGGTFTIKDASGTTLATVNTGGYYEAFTGVVKLTGLPTGTKALRLTVTAGPVTLVGSIVPSPNPPAIYWFQPGPIASNGSAASDVLLATYQAACRTILGDFPTVIPVTVGSDWDYTQHISDDGTHPNDAGNRYIAARVITTLQTNLTTLRQGLHRLTGNLAAPVYTPGRPVYNGLGATAPNAPTNVAATTARQITATWTRGTDGGATVTSQVVQVSPNGANTWTDATTVAGDATTATFLGVTQGSSYQVRVKAVNSVGSATSAASAAVTAGSASSTIALDSFTRANGSSLGSTESGGFAWTTAGGAWSIASNALAEAGGAGTSKETLIDDAVSDGTITATFPNAAANQGILFRMSGTQNANGYLVWRNGGTWTLNRRTAVNAYTQIGSGGTYAAGDIVDVVMNGSSIKIRVNGTVVINVTDATYTGTRHGFWTSNNNPGTFDDFKHSYDPLA